MNEFHPEVAKKSILPPVLKPGDTIGLVSPAGPIRNQQRFQAGWRILQEMGFILKTFNSFSLDHPYLAASDVKRREELHRLWADNEVKALLAARGGYGCLRIVSQLDYSFLSRYPKLLIGFSDITVLLNTIWQQTGIITFHGPVLTSLGRLTEVSLQNFYHSLTKVQPDCAPGGTLEILKPGMGHGPLVGGNLTTLIHLLGTPWEMDWSGKILFLEDTGEPMYKLDRMVTQLYYSGKLSRLAGLILGTFDVGSNDRTACRQLEEQLWQRVLELTREFDFPIWAGFPVGHQQDNYVLPIGMPATMDSSAGLLLFHPEMTRNP